MSPIIICAPIYIGTAHEIKECKSTMLPTCWHVTCSVNKEIYHQLLWRCCLRVHASLFIETTATATITMPHALLPAVANVSESHWNWFEEAATVSATVLKLLNFLSFFVIVLLGHMMTLLVGHRTSIHRSSVWVLAGYHCIVAWASYLQLCASVTKQYNLVLAKPGDLFGWEINYGLDRR